MTGSILLLLVLSVAGARSQCPANWTAYVHTDKCVKAFNQQMSFFDALAFCETQGFGNGGSLVSVHNSFQNAHLGSLAQKVTQDCPFWIGLYDFDTSGAYQWIDDSAVDYINWAPGYPNGNVDETAAAMSMEQRNHWVETAELSASFCFFCQQNANQDPRTSTSVLSTMTRTTARTTATTAGPPQTTISPLPTTTPTTTTTGTTATTTSPPTGEYGCVDDRHLQFGQWCYIRTYSVYLVTLENATEYCRPAAVVSIHSEEENQFVQKYTQPKVWIGLRKFDDKLYWYDHSPVDFTKFEDGLVALNGSCFIMGSDGFWSVADCELYNYHHLSYLCKYKALELTPTCQSSSLHADRGILTSPGFPMFYNASFDCKYQLEAQSGYYILIQFHTLMQIYCGGVGVFLIVYDGWEEDDSRKLFYFAGSYCSENLIESTSNRMLVVFREKACSPWTAQWYSTKRPSSPQLQQQLDSGYSLCPVNYGFNNMVYVFSPNYPFGYDTNFECMHYGNWTGKTTEVFLGIVYAGSDDYFEIIDVRTDTTVASTKDILSGFMLKNPKFSFPYAIKFRSGSDYYVLSNWKISYQFR